jgi:hypothetical protein
LAKAPLCHAVRTDALDSWFEHYNSVHPHKALGYRSPREFSKQLAEKATENAVGWLRHAGEQSGRGLHSSTPTVRLRDAQLAEREDLARPNQDGPA